VVALDGPWGRHPEKELKISEYYLTSWYLTLKEL